MKTAYELLVKTNLRCTSAQNIDDYINILTQKANLTPLNSFSDPNCPFLKSYNFVHYKIEQEMKYLTQNEQQYYQGLLDYIDGIKQKNLESVKTSGSKNLNLS